MARRRARRARCFGPDADSRDIADAGALMRLLARARGAGTGSAIAGAIRRISMGLERRWAVGEGFLWVLRSGRGYLRVFAEQAQAGGAPCGRAWLA